MSTLVLVTTGPSPNKSPPAWATKLWKAATDFEAMALGELLAPMFDTVETAHGAFGGGEGEAAWKPMLVREIGKQMEAQGGLGVAAQIFEVLLRRQEGTRS
jgi:Rod binding domain-containing protein